ncbi:MAG: hypothetical protein A2934_01220 [Candidatus Sungbacteria bacterium RIFCSPLOWO2_01_FULL_47_10]|uniref:Transcriptional repressor PaaX-like central Cas2-like domain-containing protein n=1 Tax=Candidatus Sungbacteria bacterium RIFCSPLOWO2_01_FULL_47_10 TaxID=1802276 RepID=A0A1G2L164_9BACT|nr:MAG: hypothetical protein A2934_01220 [Candidatus Sungbacteria bacterium RIFCSPLOWO2_01_FULL_47_10]
MANQSQKEEKRKYHKQLIPQLMLNEKYLIQKLGVEWEQIQNEARREVVVRKAKEAGVVAAKSILALAAICGFLTVAVVAPNIFAAFGRMGAGKRRGFYEKGSFQKSIAYLKRHGHIAVQKNESSGQYNITLTRAGRGFVLQEAFQKMKLPTERPWDGKWRLVAFDIPDKKKVMRNAFSKKLKHIGCCQLQKSLFAFPHPCNEEITFISHIYGVSAYIKYIETSLLDSDSELRKEFGLRL